MSAPAPPRWQQALALGIVYVVWGSTYLAIWLAVEAFPPFAMGALRFFTAAVLLAAAALATRQPLPTARQAAGAMALGVILLGTGNGGVVYAAGRLPSGVAALLVASLPLWILGWESVSQRRVPDGRAIGAVALGFAGVATLLAPDLLGTGGFGPGGLFAAGVVLTGTAIWSFGQYFGKRLPTPQAGIWNAACSLFSASFAFAAFALAFGEWPRVDLATVTPAAWGAFWYLVIAGSCVAWSAFAWLVKYGRPDLVATYAYVNPLVAVLLGTLWLAEPFTPAIAAGGTLIVGAVALAIRRA